MSEAQGPIAEDLQGAIEKISKIGYEWEYVDPPNSDEVLKGFVMNTLPLAAQTKPFEFVESVKKLIRDKLEAIFEAKNMKARGDAARKALDVALEYLRILWPALEQTKNEWAARGEEILLINDKLFAQAADIEALQKKREGLEREITRLSEGLWQEEKLLRRFYQARVILSSHQSTVSSRRFSAMQLQLIFQRLLDPKNLPGKKLQNQVEGVLKDEAKKAKTKNPRRKK